jgi:phage terminase large subunit-like protein
MPLTEDEEAELLALLEQEEIHKSRTKLCQMYPDTGPLRRELYAKHLQHMAAGAQRNEFGDLYNERALTGGNRSGKTVCCSYEHTCHLIGWYPKWWEGFRFNRPITGWAAGEDGKSVRESLQVTFLGPPGALGTGLIPHANIIHATPRGNIPGAVDSVTIKSAHGGISRLVFKAYDQGRESFQAAKVDVVQFDEEPASDIYTEGLTRTMSTVPGESNGLVICGFTPLRGLSAVVLSYMPGGERVEGAVQGRTV